MLNPVFPATLTLTAGAVVGFDGTTLVDAPLAFDGFGDVTTAGAFTADQFFGDGANLVNLSAGSIALGTLDDARLSSNVPLKDAANTFTAANTFRTLTITPTGATPQTALRLDASGMTGSDRVCVIDFANVNGSGGGIEFRNGSTVLVKLQANNTVQINGFSTSGGLAIGDYYFQRGTGQRLSLGEAAAGDLFHLDGVTQTTHQLLASAKSSTTNSRRVWDLAHAWADNTDASRKARVTLNAYDTAAREVMRGEASGTAPMIGFLGAAAVARPAVTGSRGGNAALASLLTALANLGLITDSTTA